MLPGVTGPAHAGSAMTVARSVARLKVAKDSLDRRGDPPARLARPRKEDGRSWRRGHPFI